MLCMGIISTITHFSSPSAYSYTVSTLPRSSSTRWNNTRTPLTFDWIVGIHGCQTMAIPRTRYLDSICCCRAPACSGRSTPASTGRCRCLCCFLLASTAAAGSWGLSSRIWIAAGTDTGTGSVLGQMAGMRSLLSRFYALMFLILVTFILVNAYSIPMHLWCPYFVTTLLLGWSFLISHRCWAIYT